MTITLNRVGTATVVTLPVDLVWVDRDSWSPVEQSVATSITGASIIDVGARISGRGITLSGDEGHAWFPRSMISQLNTWAADPAAEMALSIDGATYAVVWRHQDKPAIDVQPVVDYATPDAQDWFFGTLKFMEV